jgi:hypothetical protein
MTTTSQVGLVNGLAQYHPLIIEGMGGYDPRVPAPVAAQLAAQLRTRWTLNPPTKPVLLITQGDPIEERGISAITRLVADELSLSRALIFLDTAIADYHQPNADRYKVIMEIPYSDLASVLSQAIPSTLGAIADAIENQLTVKNSQRRALGKPPLQDYYRTFALLQEVTKAACRRLCGAVTVAHTSHTISDFSVTSFYTVGLALGLIDSAEVMSYHE